MVYGVERVFPYHCPNVEKLTVVQRGKQREASFITLEIDHLERALELKSITIENNFNFFEILNKIAPFYRGLFV